MVIGNQEVPIGGKSLGVSGVAFTFNAPEEIAPQLFDAGFNLFTLSNNHSNDMGYQGILNTLSTLENAGIKTVGMYGEKEDSEKTKIININGIRIAFLAYTYDTNIPLDNSYDYAVKTFLNDQNEFDYAHQQMIQEDVEKAKENADVVIASMHWGKEFTYQLNQAQLEASQYLNKLGVDLIIGNHPHCLQTMDILTNELNDNKTTVFYSLGNFVSAAAMVDRASVDFANMYEVGAIVNLDIKFNTDSKKVIIDNMELTPTINHFEHNYTNFSLIPLTEYTDALASKHFQHEYSDNFNIVWLSSQIEYLFSDKIKITK